MIFRKVELKDKERVIEIEKEFGRFSASQNFNEHLNPISCTDIPESHFIKNFEDAFSENKFFYVAEDGENIIGVIEAEIVENLYDKDVFREANVGYINSLFIDEQHRGRGVGKTLINEAIKWIKSRGVNLCALSVVSKNISAIETYKRLGFKEERIRMYKEI